MNQHTSRREKTTRARVHASHIMHAAFLVALFFEFSLFAALGWTLLLLQLVALSATAGAYRAHLAMRARGAEEAAGRGSGRKGGGDADETDPLAGSGRGAGYGT